jgi:hypothetical protein
MISFSPRESQGVARGSGGTVLTLLIIAFVVWVVAFRLFEVASAAIHILIALAIFRLIFRLSWGSPRKLPPAVPDRLPPARDVPASVTNRLTSGTAR